MFKKILVPTDFSDASKAALEEALMLAKIFKSKIILMHVYEPIVYYTDVPMGMPDLVEIEQGIRSTAEASLHTMVERDIKGREKDFGMIELETLLVQGKAFVEIVRTAREQAVDLIVLSTHGRSAIEHILLGSVTEKVVRKASCAVLTIRAKNQFSMP
ncbi:universal stress protein [bacterium]|nr:universal stress protein [bacterium]